MKTVQVLLYSQLRDAYLYRNAKIPSFHLVHPMKKVQGSTQNARKKAAVHRATEYLNSLTFDKAKMEKFKNLAKKDDVADSICMMLDVFIKSR